MPLKSSICYMEDKEFKDNYINLLSVMTSEEERRQTALLREISKELKNF